MSVTTYNVDAGKDRTTIELSGETKVVFSFDPNIIAVEAVSGSVNVSLDEGATAGDDGCDTLSEGQNTRMNPIADKCIYVNGTGTVKVWGGRSGEDCPFEKGGKGGGESGDGYSETVLYTNALENDPETSILLSDSYTNYDNLCVCLGKKNSYWFAPYTVCKSLMYNGSAFGLSDEVGYTNAVLTDATHITIQSAASGYGVYKVIGINYGSNGEAVANPVRSLAKSEEKPIEEELVKEEEPVEELKK